ncbi:hypothetical protein CLSAP_19560 [Clostridium saccharoperbutylacetonicum]|nr:hypothetical protein CLSAP_19560 [Clostridium saccharoperbutylacetonicum]NSB30482.1 transglutaminase-like putative cysteine protease [Clostridium saccharoperbutylacetonicum]
MFLKAMKLHVTLFKMKHIAIFEFPRGCCGDASNLLAKFLRDNGIECEYVCGIKGQQSHV